MDFNFNEQEKMLQSMAKEFATKSVEPRAAEIDRTDKFPFDLADEMGKLGASLREQLVICNHCKRRGKKVTNKFCDKSHAAILGCIHYLSTQD